MDMKTNHEVLSSILRTAQTGQAEIHSILLNPMCPGLRKVLEAQLSEYGSIEMQANYIASQRGWELDELQPGMRFLASKITGLQLRFGNTDSQIAGMMIKICTNRIINEIRIQHQWSAQDSYISFLSQKLLDSENSSIRQIQQYL